MLNPSEISYLRCAVVALCAIENNQEPIFQFDDLTLNVEDVINALTYNKFGYMYGE